MARALTIGVVVLAASLLDDHLGAGTLCAQEPDWYASSHPYLEMARYNEPRSRAARTAARFDYRPYYPGYYQRQKPFELSVLPRPQGIARDAAADRHASLLREFADELDYYGFGELAGDFIP
jgi:hypothetical protein